MKKFTLIFSLLSVFSTLVAMSPSSVKAACDMSIHRRTDTNYSCPTTVPIDCEPGADHTEPFLCCTSSSECSSALSANEVFCDGQVGRIRTAIGCINASNPQAMVGQIVNWSLGIAAGAAFVTIAYSGFLITTAGGDVKKVNNAKDWLVSSLLGLLLISIALLLLNFIGVRIFNLQLYGFGV
jgi:hypothetical protein